MTTPDDAVPARSLDPIPGQPDWFGHPRQLRRLFTIEMWERFGFYGMRVLLTLYLTKHFLFTDSQAVGLFGGYMALIYLTPVVGGLVADQFLGAKRSVKFGAVLMAAGYFGLAFAGAPAQPFTVIDGHSYATQVSHFHDGPTSDKDQARFLVIDGQRLAARGLEDGSLSLLAASGKQVRHIAKGHFSADGTRSALHVAVMLVALAAVCVGNGFFKPNISTIVGSLYAPRDRRRDAGFSIFYMGVNLGSFLGQILCPVIADHFGWGAGLSLAGFGMVISWLLLHFGEHLLAGYGEMPVRQGPDRSWPIYALAVAAVPVVYWLLNNVLYSPPPAVGAGFSAAVAALPLLNKLQYALFGLGVPAILVWAWRHGAQTDGKRIEFEMMLAAMVLVSFDTIFWMLFEQAGSSLTLFADRNANLSVFGLFSISAPQTQQFNSIDIIVFAPIMGWLWGWLGKRGWEPSIPLKFGLALVGVGAGFLFLVLGTRFVGPDYRVGIWWLVGLYLFHSIAELCISPIGLSMITKLSIARIVGLMMGVWFMSLSIGESLAGLLAQSASVQTVGGQVTNLRISLETYVATYREFGWITVGVGVVLIALSRPMKRLMHGVT